MKALNVILISLTSLGILSSSPRRIRAAETAPLVADLGEDLGEALLLTPQALDAPSPPSEPYSERSADDMAEPWPARDESLSRVVGHMQKAQSLLARSDASGSASAAQVAALRGLDALIAELASRQNRCRAGRRRGGDSKTPSPPQASDKPNAYGASGSSPARSAPATTGQVSALPNEGAAIGAFGKDLWGQLPQRLRQRLLQPQRDEFLPKYASEIEAYFRALADPNRTVDESP